MANKLLESYKPRLQLAENLFVRKTGQKLSADDKLVMATCLDNCRKSI